MSRALATQKAPVGLAALQLFLLLRPRRVKDTRALRVQSTPLRGTGYSAATATVQASSSAPRRCRTAQASSSPTLLLHRSQNNPPGSEKASSLIGLECLIKARTATGRRIERSLWSSHDIAHITPPTTAFCPPGPPVLAEHLTTIAVATTAPGQRKHVDSRFRGLAYSSTLRSDWDGLS
ncbi:hypothetical protein ACHAPX_003496 [Trichoderma viride]